MIAFSSDLQKVLLVDDTNVFEFDLNSPKGITIGILGGQLAAIAGTNVLIDQATSDSKTFSLPAVAGQWTLLYEAKENRLSVIGADSVNVMLGIGNLPSNLPTGHALIQNMRAIGTGDVEGTTHFGNGDEEGTRLSSAADLVNSRNIGTGDVEGTRGLSSDSTTDTNPAVKWYYLDLNTFALNIRRSGDQLIFQTQPK